jgi:CheY-like chemotaxis protein
MILGGAPDVDVVAEAADGQDAVDVVLREAPDVVLMDIRMPRMDGLAATRRLLDRGTSARIIVLTTFDTDDMVVAALSYGAAASCSRTHHLPTSSMPYDGSRPASRSCRPSVTAQLIATVTRRATRRTSVGACASWTGSPTASATSRRPSARG